MRHIPAMCLVAIAACLAAAQPARADDASDCYESSGETAIRGCSKLIERNPKDAKALYLRGLEYAERGDHEAAIADFTLSIAAAPADPDPLIARAVSFEATGDTDKALADHRAALVLAPGDERAKAGLKRLGVEK